MADTFYDRVDSGAAAAPFGYLGGSSRPSSVGGFVTSSMPTAPNSYLASPGPRPAAPPIDPVTALANEYKTLLKSANDANLARDAEGRRLLGIPTGSEWKEAGFATPDAYERHKAFASQPAYTDIPVPKPVDPQQYATAAVGSTRQQSIDRGIYNTSTSLNRENAAATRAAQEAAAANFRDQVSAYQLGESARRFNADQATQLRGEQLNWIDSRNDIPPDMSRLERIAATLGEGNTAGMMAPTVGGGGGGGYGGPIGGSAYGGAGGMGYFVPQNMGFSTPARPPKREVKRVRPVPVRPTAITYGVDAPLNKLQLAGTIA
jgi:hypothetical protein